MPTSGMSFTSGPGQLSCERSGWVTSVRHEDSPGVRYLSGACLGELGVDGDIIEPGDPDVQADLDEVEFGYNYPGRFRVVVRHTFAAGWGIRIAFSSLSARTQVFDRAVLRLAPAPGCVAWALALGARATYVVMPPDATEPVLGCVLRRGSVSGVTDLGLELTRFKLRAGSRYVVQLHWGWYATPRAFSAEHATEVPSTLFLTAGESVQILLDDDVAVVAPAGLETTQVEGQLEISSEIVGRYPFELRSARGTTAFDLEWVGPVEELLASLLPVALTRPRTAAGVIKLGGVADALVVQHGLLANRVDDPDEAAEALDLFTARISGAAQVSLLEAAFLGREFDRLGDPDLLGDAATAVLSQPEPLPGLALAATQVCLGLMVSGQPVAEILAQLLRLAEGVYGRAGVSASRVGPAEAPADVSRQVAELELIAVTHAGPGLAGVITRPPDVSPRIAALGRHLGAGLPGRAVLPLPVEQLSHLISVFHLLPDGLSSELVALWGCSARDLAQRATPELLTRLDGRPIGDAHAWLVLALQTG